MIIAPIIRGINKGISSGIGLAGEKYHDRKDRKTALAEQDRNSRVTELVDPLDPGEETADDERIWALDDASGPPDYNTSQSRPRPGVERTVSDLVHEVAVTKESQEPVVTGSTAALPYPIIIPQRRPGTKTRGWVRAYPPDLKALGVEDDTFLRFLQNFEDAQEASPWLRALYVAGGVVGLVPGTITRAVSISLIVAAGYDQSMSRTTNTDEV
jgi:hypothetical protein